MDIFRQLSTISPSGSARPADEDENYGHGKAESLAGLFQSIVIAASGSSSLESIRRIINPNQTSSEWMDHHDDRRRAGEHCSVCVKARGSETESPPSGRRMHYVTDITQPECAAGTVSSGCTGEDADTLISIAYVYILVCRSWAGINRPMDRRLPLGGRANQEVVERTRIKACSVFTTANAPLRPQTCIDRISKSSATCVSRSPDVRCACCAHETDSRARVTSTQNGRLRD